MTENREQVRDGDGNAREKAQWQTPTLAVLDVAGETEGGLGLISDGFDYS